jgi:hypothetical protein
MKIILNTNYKVDELGNVYGLSNNKLKPATDKKGYLRVGLMINKKLQTKKVHRLVAQAFIENPQNKPCVNHINCIKSDNRVLNLEWCTHKENTQHAIKNNVFSFQNSDRSTNINPKKGELNGMAKLKAEQVLQIRELFKPRIFTRKMLAQKFNVTENCIKDVLSFKSWK